MKKLFTRAGRVVALVTGLASLGAVSLGLAALGLSSFGLSSCDMVTSGNDNAAAPIYGIRLRSDPANGVIPTATEGYGTPPFVTITVVNEGNRDTGPLAITLAGTGTEGTNADTAFAEEPSTEEPSTEEPSTEEPSTEEPSTEEPSTEEPSTEESPVDSAPADTAAFKLETEIISNIMAGGSSLFRVSPIAGLPVRGAPYSASVTVAPAAGSRTNIQPQTINVSFKVESRRVGIDLLVGGASSSEVSFVTADADYTPAPDAKTVVIVNKTDAPISYLTITLEDYTEDGNENGNEDGNEDGNKEALSVSPKEALSVSPKDAFRVSPGMVNNIETAFPASFTVQPKLGLPVGKYTAKVMVKGGANEASLTVSFNVQPVTEISLSVDVANANADGSYTFPSAVKGKPETYKSPIVTVTNKGTKPTGALTIVLTDTTGSNISGDPFTLSPATLKSIAAGGTGSFKITPNDKLPVGNYSAKVTVSGGGGVSAELKAAFTAEDPNYSIALKNTDKTDLPTEYPFPTAVVNYEEPLPVLEVVISNSGNLPTGALTIELTDAEGAFKLNDGTTSSISIDDIAVGGTAEFTVRPILGLTEDTYTATVTVKGGHDIEKTFTVSFEVEPGTYAIELKNTDDTDLPTEYTFPLAVVNYKEPPPELDVVIRNSGNQSTGALTIALSEGGGAWFTLSKTEITDIVVDDTADFTVVPNTGLSSNTYTATVIVKGGHDIEKTFIVSFKVEPEKREISLSPTSPLDFGEADADYTEPAMQAIAKTIKITNTGNQPTGELKIVLTDTDGEPFVIDPKTITDIAVGDTVDFTVRPNTGLAMDEDTTYEATVSVSGKVKTDTAKSFTVKFKVKAKTYGISLSDSNDNDLAEPLEFAKVQAPYKEAELETKTIKITNTGTGAIGNLEVALDETTDSDAFTVTPSSLNIAATDGEAEFTVKPKTGLGKDEPYTATVTVKGGHNIEKTFNVSFKVELPSEETPFSNVLKAMEADAGKPNGTYTIEASGGEDDDFETALLAAYGFSNIATGADLTLNASNSPANVVIDGGGRTIDATTTNANSDVVANSAATNETVKGLNAATRSLTIGNGVSVTLKNITFKSVPFKVASGGKLVLDTGVVIKDNKSHYWHDDTWGVFYTEKAKGFEDGTGVRVEDGGELVMKTGSKITGNEHSGVQVFGNGKFTMEDGEISGNFILSHYEAEGKWFGAGVSLSDNAEFTMKGGNISGNEAKKGQVGVGDDVGVDGVGAGGGVGVYERAKFYLEGGEVLDNKAGVGGGVYMDGKSNANRAILRVSGGQILNNRSTFAGDPDWGGGGVYAWRANISMTGGSIRENDCAGPAGAIYLLGPGDLSITGGIIEGNTAAANGAGIYLNPFFGACTMNEGRPKVIANGTENPEWGQTDGTIKNNRPRNIRSAATYSSAGWVVP